MCFKKLHFAFLKSHFKWHSVNICCDCWPFKNFYEEKDKSILTSFTAPPAYGTVLWQHSHLNSALLPHFPSGDAQAYFLLRIVCTCIKVLPRYLDGQHNHHGLKIPFKRQFRYTDCDQDANSPHFPPLSLYSPCYYKKVVILL